MYYNLYYHVWILAMHLRCVAEMNDKFIAERSLQREKNRKTTFSMEYFSKNGDIYYQ